MATRITCVVIEDQMDLGRICPFREHLQALFDEEDEISTLRPTIAVDRIHGSDVDTRLRRVSGVVRRCSNRLEDLHEHEGMNERETRRLSILIDVNRETSDVVRTTEFLLTSECRRSGKLRFRDGCERELEIQDELHKTDE